MTTPATGLNSSMKPTMSTTATASRRSRPVRLANKNPAACRFALPTAGFGVPYPVRYPMGGAAGASRDRIGSRDANGRSTTTTSATINTPSAMPDSTSWT